jgi:hypothetical protein
MENPPFGESTGNICYMFFEALKQIKDDMVCDMWLALKLDMDMWVP